MVTPNGTPPPPDAGPQQVIPRVGLHYKEHPNGSRQITAVEIAGVRFGGVVAVDTGADMTKPSTLPANVVRLVLETVWPFEWKDEAKFEPQLAVATSMPPEPPRGPRRMDP